MAEMGAAMLGLTLGVCASARCCGNAGEVGYQWKGNVLMMLKVGLKHNIISNRALTVHPKSVCLSAGPAVVSSLHGSVRD